MDELVVAIEGRVRAFAGRHMSSLADARVVVGASGGADSAAAVALLCEAGLIDRRRAVVAHFDHRLRGEADAAADLEAVCALCRRYGIELVTGEWASPVVGEAAAREARYRFLRETAAKHGARVVITGHTSDDQVETVLMHALRGAGLHGLAGMAAVSRLPGEPTSGVEVWRPLLWVSREETRAYCAARGLGYVDDPSNEDRAFLRNRIRLDVLPRIERAAPRVRSTLLALASAAREGVVAFEEAAADALVAATVADGGEVMLSRRVLRELPAEVVPYAYRLGLVRLLGDARDFDRRHYARLARAAFAATGSMFELPRGVVATVDAEAIVLSVGAPGAPTIAMDFVVPLPYVGAAGAWSIEVAPVRARAPAAVSGEGEALVLPLPPDAVVRGRRPGDRVLLRGGGHKKLQDVYVDAKVPRRERESAPVIALGGDVLWTPLAVRAIAVAPVAPKYRVTARRMGSAPLPN